MFKGGNLRRLLIAVGIQSLQQAQGSSYTTNYIVSFIQSMGVADVFPVIMGVWVAYWLAILTGHYFPDQFGRRPVIMITAMLCGISIAVIAILITTVTPSTSASQQASIALLVLWQVAFGVQCPIVWITTAEAAPSRHRERGPSELLCSLASVSRC